LDWAREIQALAQTGRHYAVNEYQLHRYARLTEIAAEIVAEHSTLPQAAAQAVFQAHEGYATPRVDVRAAAFQDGKLLLVRERSDGGWTLPGGWADVGDVPSQAAEREAWEEAGFHVRARQVVGVYDANRFGPLELFHAYKLVFLCEVLDGQPTPSNETSEVAFFAQEAIPAPLSNERTRPQQIEDAFRAYANPGTPTVFD
jgi:ADP-ribose pyrophosphatase YjhB (NUDIX family)